MKFVCEYQKDGQLGIIKLSGDKYLQDARETWGMIGGKIQEDCLEGVLLIDNSTTKLKAHEVLEVAKHFEKIKLSFSIKIAIVDPRPPSQSNNPFGETVAHNRMWQLISVFKDETSARAWLSEKI